MFNRCLRLYTARRSVLRFAEGERAPEIPPVDAPGVHVWHDRRGGVVAWGFRHDGQYCMHWPSLATFRFSSDDPNITAFPAPRISLDFVWDTYRRSVLPMALQALGWEALHASAIVCRSGVVAFCAASETGKSTIAFALRRRGYPQWSDDGVVFRTERGVAVTIPLPFEVRLRRPSREIFADAPLATRFQGNRCGDQVHVKPAPLSAICVLHRIEAAPGTAAVVEGVPRADAFPMVLEHGHVFDPFDIGRRARMIDTYLDVAEQVPVYRAHFAPDPNGLDLLLDDIVEGLGLPAPVPQTSLVAV